MHRVTLAQLIIRTRADLKAILPHLRQDPGMAWYAMRGGAHYLQSIAAGDCAPMDDVKVRLAVCQQCPSCQPTPGSPRLLVGYCGQPLHDGREDTPPTCGCFLPAKVCVASERCPQEKWLAVPKDAPPPEA